MGQRLTSFTSDGLRFDVRDDGPLTGPVVVALHGFPQTSACWSALTPHLVAAGYRVLAPDQRGYSPGARPPDVGSYPMAALTGDVLALLDAAGLSRVHLLGHDWGAGVAWVFAGAHAHRVATLTALSVPHPAAMVRALVGSQALRSWYMAAFQVPGLAERFFAAREGALVRQLLVRSGMPDPEPSVRLLTDRAAATAALNWYRALRLPGGLRARRTTVPTLYVWSTQDAALGRRGAELTGRYVRGPYRYAVLPRTSHWIPEQRPAELAALLLDHLGEHADR